MKPATSTGKPVEHSLRKGTRVSVGCSCFKGISQPKTEVTYLGTKPHADIDSYCTCGGGVASWKQLIIRLAVVTRTTQFSTQLILPQTLKAPHLALMLPNNFQAILQQPQIIFCSLLHASRRDTTHVLWGCNCPPASSTELGKAKSSAWCMIQEMHTPCSWQVGPALLLLLLYRTRGCRSQLTLHGRWCGHFLLPLHN